MFTIITNYKKMFSSFIKNEFSETIKLNPQEVKAKDFEGGELKDLDYLIEKDCSIKIFTSKNPEGLETIRHDTAHILAMAVQELFPGTQVTIGPVIEDGFYYDFARKEPFTEDDLL